MTAANKLLSPAICEHIDKWLLKYPPEQKRSAVFEALRVVQEAHGGWLTVELLDAVADYLGIAKIAVYEVATFYTMYSLTPQGQHVINLCTNISCSLNGAQELEKHLHQRLGIGFNETTSDGKFSLKEVECLGACVAPPACQIGKHYFLNLTPEKIDAILDDLAQQEITPHGQ